MFLLLTFFPIESISIIYLRNKDMQQMKIKILRSYLTF